jgi:hypothetical protein
MLWILVGSLLAASSTQKRIETAGQLRALVLLAVRERPRLLSSGELHSEIMEHFQGAVDAELLHQVIEELGQALKLMELAQNSDLRDPATYRMMMATGWGPQMKALEELVYHNPTRIGDELPWTRDLITRNFLDVCPGCGSPDVQIPEVAEIAWSGRRGAGGSILEPNLCGSCGYSEFYPNILTFRRVGEPWLLSATESPAISVREAQGISEALLQVDWTRLTRGRIMEDPSQAFVVQGRTWTPLLDVGASLPPPEGARAWPPDTVRWEDTDLGGLLDRELLAQVSPGGPKLGVNPAASSNDGLIATLTADA